MSDVPRQRHKPCREHINVFPTGLVHRSWDLQICGCSTGRAWPRPLRGAEHFRNTPRFAGAFVLQIPIFCRVIDIIAFPSAGGKRGRRQEITENAGRNLMAGHILWFRPRRAQHTGLGKNRNSGGRNPHCAFSNGEKYAILSCNCRFWRFNNRVSKGALPYDL